VNFDELYLSIAKITKKKEAHHEPQQPQPLQNIAAIH